MYQNGFPVGYNTNNLYNPQPTNQDQNTMVWVQGIEGAKSYILGKNVTQALWDSEEQVIYLKSTDQNGIPQPLRILDYTERKPTNPEDKFLTKDEFYKAMNEIKEAINGKSLVSTDPISKSTESDLKSI